MNRTLFIIITAGLFLHLPIQAQKNIIYRHHHIHELISNPALAGNSYLPQAAVSYQKQWLGISQSPYTLIASANYRVGTYDFYNPKMMVNKSNLSAKERMGLGIGLFSDKNGPLSSHGIKLAYAYHLSLESSNLGFGIAISMNQNMLDGTVWEPVQADDPLLNPSKESWFQFNTDVGLVYTSENFYGGFAVNDVMPLENHMRPRERIRQDYVLHGAYLIGNNKKVKLEPALHLRYLDYETLEYDARLKTYIDHVHWLTLTYRSYKALALGAGFKIGKQLYIAYQFESNLSCIVNYSAGSHTIHLGMNLGVRAWEGYF